MPDLVKLPYLFKRYFFKRGNSPAYFIYFLTSRCVFNCRHCFYHSREYGERELTLEEINRFSASMGRIAFLLLTGGEPFLREDFEEIPRIFYKNTNVRNIAVPTNGFFTDDIIRKTERVLKNCPRSALTVNVSLDGIGDLHDHIRQKKGAFLSAAETCRRLVDMKKRFRNLDVGVCTVISSLNQDKLEEIYKFVTKDLDIKIWAPFVTRGSPRDPGTLDIDIESYKRIGVFMKREIEEGKYKGYRRFFLGSWNTAKNTLRRDIIYEIKKKRKKLCACYAGSLAGVMFPDGTLKPCELREETFGNIRDFDYNFSSLWRSPKAEKIRRGISSGQCFCTHECFLTMNLFFNVKFLIRLAGERLRLLSR